MAADPPTASDLPDALTSRPQWLCWRRQERDDKQTKVPIDPTTGQYASATDSVTWTEFAIARAYVTEDRADGVGFAFTADDPIMAVDLDDCRKPTADDHAPWAQRIIETLDSYTEISLSGTGYHVLVEGSIPGDRCRSGDDEIDETDRFFTVTGEHVPETPRTVQSRVDELAAVYDEHIRGYTDTSIETDSADRSGDSTTPTATSDSGPSDSQDDKNRSSAGTDLSDEDLLERARTAANGDKFRALWRGSTTGYESHSTADMALCSLLAF